MGGEFRALLPYLQNDEIHFSHPSPHTHQQNGRARRKHRHIVKLGLVLLAQASMPLSYWWSAFQTAVYLRNKQPSSVLAHNSPFQSLFHQIPYYKS